jgi:SpoVK/Ycf46/Vps4 family AAA+-type ATPase
VLSAPHVVVPPPSSHPAQAPSELDLLVRSHFSLVFVETVEEQRAERLIFDSASRCARQALVWSVSTGLVAPRERNVNQATVQPVDALRTIARLGGTSVYAMRGMAAYLDDPVVVRLIADIARMDGITLVLIEPSVEIPELLRPHSTRYVLPRPDIALIDTRVRELIEQHTRHGSVANNLTEADLQSLVRALRGLTLEEVDQVMLRIMQNDGQLSATDIQQAIASKGELLARQGVVELVHPEGGMEWVAGFHHLREWITLRGRALQPGAEQFGLTPPRGFLLTGVPGCGKSFVVKALAHSWNMPLLRLDAGSLYDKFVGATERNLRDALATAEALSPSILWIDEIEKAFGTKGPSETDGGLGYRMVGALATWMQERKATVFLAATSNDISLLPPELTRQGRFDEIFFVDLPDEPARQHMYMLALARRGRPHQSFDCAAMAAASEGFSGAEIEQSLANALYAAFASQRDVSTQDILAEIAATRPLSQVSPEVIAKIRHWGSQHARPA